ncbi:MAG: UDP-N-acetylmuramate dehydrogenase [Thermanaerothrix sp.]|nr:UDP-N-acetylmuramate dehydrogenase [Thermanaerothrix sp.]
MIRWLLDLDRKGLCAVRPKEPLRFWNTWGVGGCAEAVVSPRSESALGCLRKVAYDEGVRTFVLGEGSNVLIPDEGLVGWVVLLRDDTSPPLVLSSSDSEVEVQVSAALPLRRLLNWAVRRGLSGLEFSVGIPGTVGGAVAGNAGAKGRSIGDLVTFVRTVEEDGSVRVWGGDELSFSYRKCGLSSGRSWITSVGLKLHPSSDGDIRQRLRHFASFRKGQPKNARTAGCVFKNPPGGSAGMMLDAAGCKGLRVGGAMVSMQHANFIENLGDATAGHIMRLVDICRGKVMEKFEVSLELEVRFLGDGSSLPRG